MRAVRARYTVPPKQALDVVVKSAGDAENQCWSTREFGVRARARGRRSLRGADDRREARRTRRRSSRRAWRSTSRSRGSWTSRPSASGLRKEREKAAAELERLGKKLSNEGFLAKAAPEIVEKDRARAAELADELALIDAQLAELA